MLKDRISVMVCVNNPDNGNYAGRCAGIHVDDFIQLEPRVLPEPRCTLKSDYFSIHRRRFKVRQHQTWVGNWCWDAITLTRADVARLIATVLTQKWQEYRVWGIDCAEGEECIALMHRLDAGDEPSEADWLAALTAAVRA